MENVTEYICTNSEYWGGEGGGEGPGNEASLAIHGKYQAGATISSFQVVKAHYW